MQVALGSRQDRVAREVADARSARIDHLEDYQSALIDIETGQRGYVLTGQPRFLEPVGAARSSIAALEPALRADAQRFGDEAAIRALIALGQRKILRSEEIIALQRSGSGDLARSRIRAGTGKRLMDEVRAAVRTLVAADSQALGDLLAGEGARRERRERNEFATQVALLLMLALLTALSLRALQRMRTATRAAEDHATRQSAIYEGATDAMLILDSSGRIESLNAAAERLFGYRRTGLVGKSNLSLFDQPPSEEASRAYLARLADDGEGKGNLQTFRGRRGDGALIDAEAVTTAIRLGDGVHFLVVARDATERQRVQRMKDEFVSTVSHELRTPMTAIAGALAMLDAGAGGPLPDKAARMVTIAHGSSRRMVRLVNDILDLEKLGAGQMALDRTTLSLRSVIDEVATTLEPFAADHQVTIDPGIGDGPVMADRDRLVQVITNILSNAIKFSPEGGTVECRLAPNGDGQRLSIIDHGPGIDPAFRDRLFMRFAQADGSSRRKVGGTGLGLAISRELSEQMDIAIGVDSRPGLTAFHLDFPPAADRGDE